ncbi:MAG: hypothetical protein K2X47_14265 [Bdellovibrionales bacterium]|nr:hypothetical protein [Bdellovibrionales bacterium]
MATQEFTSVHHDSQISQEAIAASQADLTPALDIDHNDDSHSSAADCNDCCVAGCSHHPAMIVSISTGFIMDKSILGLRSPCGYQSPVISTLERPPIA